MTIENNQKTHLSTQLRLMTTLPVSVYPAKIKMVYVECGELLFSRTIPIFGGQTPTQIVWEAFRVTLLKIEAKLSNMRRGAVHRVSAFRTNRPSRRAAN